MESTAVPWLLHSDIVIVFGYKNSLLYDLRENYVRLIWFTDYETYQLKNFLLNKKETPFVKYILHDVLQIKSSELKQPKRLDLKLKYYPNEFSFAWIEVTNKCNLKCLHCYGNFGLERAKDLSIKEISLIIRELKKIGIEKVQLIGGEPLLLPHLLDIILLLKKSGFDEIEIFTNATLMTDKLAYFFHKHSIKVALSLYSYDPRTHDKITQVKNSFKHLQNALIYLDRYDVKYRISVVKMKYNYQTDLLKIRKVLKLKNTVDIREDIVRIVREDLRKILNIEQLKKKRITLDSFKESSLPSSFVKRNFFRHNCFSTKIYIDVFLDVYPCVMERRVKYGNLNHDSLENILRKHTHIINLTKDNIEHCSLCEFRYVCFDCRPDNTYNFLSKPQHCKYNPYRGIWND